MPKATGKDAVRKARQRIQEEGLMIAVQTAIDICRDPHAAAAAKASAINSLMRGGGMYGRQDSDTDEKEDYEKSLAELVEDVQLSRLRRADELGTDDLDAIDDGEDADAALPDIFD